MAWRLHGKYEREPKQRCSSVRWAPFYYSSYRSACLRYITWYKTYKLDLAHPHNFPLQVAKTEQGTRKGKMEKKNNSFFFVFYIFSKFAPKIGVIFGVQNGGTPKGNKRLGSRPLSPSLGPKNDPIFFGIFRKWGEPFLYFFLGAVFKTIILKSCLRVRRVRCDAA